MSLLLAALVLMLSVRLLQESQVVFLDWQRLTPQPAARLTEGLIRADVQAASRIEPTLGPGYGTGLWSGGSLELVYADGRRVRYGKQLATLVRSLETVDRELEGSRPVLGRVANWKWRRLEGDVVEIDLAYKRPRDPGSRLTGSRAMRRARETRLEHLRLTYAIRDRSGRHSW